MGRMSRASLLASRPPASRSDQPWPSLTRRDIFKAAGTVAATLVMPDSLRAATPPDLSSLVVQRLNWTGIRLEMGDSALFIDATAADPDSPEVPVTPSTTRPRSYALVTHAHGDHFDPALLRTLLGERGYLVCHRDSVPYIDLRTIRVSPVDLWEPVFIPRGGSDFVAFAVPAADGWGLPQVSWIVEAAGRRIIHCGDTMWHGRLADIGIAYGPFDVAFLPINGARQTVGRFADHGIPGVMTPEQAIAAAQSLRANLVVPLHYGNPTPPTYLEVANAGQAFLDLSRQHQIPARLLGPGEFLSLPATPK